MFSKKMPLLLTFNNKKAPCCVHGAFLFSIKEFEEGLYGIPENRRRESSTAKGGKDPYPMKKCTAS